MSWLDTQPEEMIFISVITLAELKQSIESVESSKSRARMNDWLMNDLLVRFSGRINEINAEVTLKWGEISARAHNRGNILDPIDTLNTATAMIYNHTLVTTRSEAFEGAEVRLFNPCSNEHRAA
jgi:predicted nucleic acid-binding protein